jgi:predicted aldo/keto reductase-like oxidoreductase
MALAQEVGGPGHHFRIIQLPHNLAMPEALITMNQTIDGTDATPLEAAFHHRLFVMASASILQGNLASELPAEIRTALPGLATDAQRAIEFTRSTPGVGAALVGMKSLHHVEENLGVLREPRLTTETFLEHFTTAP